MLELIREGTGRNPASLAPESLLFTYDFQVPLSFTMKRSFSGQRPDSPVGVLLRAKHNHGNTAGMRQVLFFFFWMHRLFVVVHGLFLLEDSGFLAPWHVGS